MSDVTGRIEIAGTPIGNIADASPRLVAALEEADVVACEDTRTTAKLLRALGIRARGELVAYHEHNERSRAEELVDRARRGAHVVVVSDAGMPGISDPGYRIVAQAVVEDVPVTVIPGPSALICALAASGLPTDRFTFEGFMPRKASERTSAIRALSTETRTVVFYETPHRIEATLEALAEGLGGDRRAVISREITKMYEEHRRGTLDELLAGVVADPPRGEIVVVLEGASEQVEASVDELVPVVLERVAEGERLKDVCKALAEAYGVSRRELYDATVKARP